MQSVKKTKSYFRITEAANHLFHKYGIKKVSVEELCQNAEVSKMTFYRLFKNKEELVRHILILDFENAFNEQVKLFKSDLAFKEKLQNALALKYERSKQYSMEFVSDLYTSKDDAIIKLMHDLGQKGLLVFRNFLESGQKEGFVRKEVKIDFIMLYLNFMQEKLINKEMLALFESAEDLSRHVTDMFFYGVLAKEMND